MKSRIRIANNFFLDEYIPKKLYDFLVVTLKKTHLAIGLLDKRLIQADQMLRDEFGPTTINNWIHDGPRNWSGIRTPESLDYSFTSQHPYGRASDKIYTDASAEEVRRYIKKHWKELGITCIESDVGWVHSDTRWIYNQRYLLIVPRNKSK